jgi:hypothetical protein
MPAPRFLRLAYRIGAYDGMLTRRLEAQRDRDRPASAPSPRPAASSTGARSGQRARPAAAAKHLAKADVVPVGAMAMQFPGLIERSRASAEPSLDGSAPPVEAPRTES